MSKARKPKKAGGNSGRKKADRKGGGKAAADDGDPKADDATEAPRFPRIDPAELRRAREGRQAQAARWRELVRAAATFAEALDRPRTGADGTLPQAEADAELAAWPYILRSATEALDRCVAETIEQYGEAVIAARKDLSSEAKRFYAADERRGLFTRLRCEGMLKDLSDPASVLRTFAVLFPQPLFLDKAAGSAIGWLQQAIATVLDKLGPRIKNEAAPEAWRQWGEGEADRADAAHEALSPKLLRGVAKALDDMCSLDQKLSGVYRNGIDKTLHTRAEKAGEQLRKLADERLGNLADERDGPEAGQPAAADGAADQIGDAARELSEGAVEIRKAAEQLRNLAGERAGLPQCVGERARACEVDRDEWYSASDVLKYYGLTEGSRAYSAVAQQIYRYMKRERKKAHSRLVRKRPQGTGGRRPYEILGRAVNESILPLAKTHI